jgi:integrase/recombinase XerD
MVDNNCSSIVRLHCPTNNSGWAISLFNLYFDRQYFLIKSQAAMAQASVLSDNDVRRVFRVIETMRHADRNRAAFILSIYAGMRVGEIASLKIVDVINRYGEVRSEIKLGSHQTKGPNGRTVVLSGRVRREMGALKSQPLRHLDIPLIISQRNRRAFTSLTLSILFKEIYEMAGIRTSPHSRVWFPWWPRISFDERQMCELDSPTTFPKTFPKKLASKHAPRWPHRSQRRRGGKSDQSQVHRSLEGEPSSRRWSAWHHQRSEAHLINLLPVQSNKPTRLELK